MLPDHPEFQGLRSFYLRDISLDEIRDKEIWNEHIFTNTRPFWKMPKMGNFSGTVGSGIKGKAVPGCVPGAQAIDFPSTDGKENQTLPVL